MGFLQELDKILACKIFGYKTVGELYDDSNGVVWIPRIRTPCLLISADDDPFLDPKCASPLIFLWHTNQHLWTTEAGPPSPCCNVVPCHHSISGMAARSNCLCSPCSPFYITLSCLKNCSAAVAVTMPPVQLCFKYPQ